MKIRKSEITVIQLKQQDWHILRDIRLRALQSDPGMFGSNYTKEEKMHEEDWSGWLNTPDAATFILKHGEIPIGLTGIAIKKDDPSNRHAVLWGSWIEPEYRGNGLSTMLYTARLKWAQAHPTCKIIHVSHRASNHASKCANQKHGFSFVGTARKLWPDGVTENEMMYNLNLKKSTGTPVMPPEWAHQDALWTAWPSHNIDERWGGDKQRTARLEIAAMIRHAAAGQTVNVLASGEEPVTSARAAIGDVATVIPAKFGDIWLRDTGPIFGYDGDELIGLRFTNNGWGGKYLYEFDDIVGDTIANKAGALMIRHDFVLEGGSIEIDGAGNLMTTRQCILNSNRNGSLSENDAEKRLNGVFGTKRVIWLDKGMLNDHTDGHIDNIARFVAPNHVVCQSPFGKDDPNRDVFSSIYKTLKEAGVTVTQVPSPGLYHYDNGDIGPASHMNFIITNAAVIVPTYGSESEGEALSILQSLFPNRSVVGCPANTVLTGGGSFHCITQQQPAKD